MEEERNAQSNDGPLSEYANNSLFEPSVWDLKIIFGQLYRAKNGKSDVDWHTAITLPWPQVKLFAYYLQVNLAMHEAENGVVKVPERLHPAELIVTEEEEKQPDRRAMLETLQRMRQELIDSMK
jgi:hypothetical protein